MSTSPVSGPPAAAPSSGSQRRYLTVLFSALAGADERSEARHDEHHVALLENVRRLCHDTITHHGGRIARLQGDGVVAVFGDPEPGEDDGRRAVDAALALQAAVSGLAAQHPGTQATALRLRTGIHAGLTLCLQGDVERGSVELLGSVPNFAARLCELARPGEICVSEETLGPQRHFFETSEREWVSLRGGSAPMAALRVRGRAALQRRFEARGQRGDAPLAGREQEFRRLRGELLQVPAGQAPRCIAVAGGPGLGKTRLVEELLGDPAVEPFTTLRGYCESYLGAEPLQPFLQMLRALCGIAPGVSALDALQAARVGLAGVQGLCEDEQATLLQALAPAAFGAQAASAGAEAAHGAATLVALRGLFGALAARRPLLLLIDDWQWADDASRQVLDAVRALAAPVCLLLLVRGSMADIAADRVDASLELGPLSLEATARTVAHLLPDADPFVVGEIHRHAGGNPLFIEELCHSAAAARGVPLEQPPSGAAWLQVLIESRVGRLPPAQRELLRAAAVLGNVFPGWLLQSVTGRGAHDPDLQALAEKDFLFPSPQAGSLRFKHGITRDVVYQVVGLHERRALHLRAAAALAERSAGALTGLPGPGHLNDEARLGVAQETLHELPHEALAYHLGAGGAHAQAAEHAERAADKAMAALALDRARSLYTAALASLDALSAALPMPGDRVLRWCAIVQKLGMACVFDPLGLATGLAVFERGVALARESGDLDTLARAEYWLGYVSYAKGRPRQATGHCETALALALQAGNDRLAAQVVATLGQAHASAAHYERALALLDTAVESKRKQSRPGSSVAVGSAYSLSCKGCVLGDQGRFEEAHACFEQALALLGGSMHQVGSSVRGWISTVHLWQGNWQSALDMADAGARIAEHVRSRHLLAMNLALGGYARWRLRGEPQGLQAVRDATAWIEARNGAFFISLNHGWIIDGAAALGRHGEARRHAARLLLRSRDHDRLGEAIGCRAMVAAALRARDTARAERWLRRAERSAELRGSRHEAAKNLLSRARVASARGEPGAARAAVEQACDAFDHMQMASYLALGLERLRAL